MPIGQGLRSHVLFTLACGMAVERCVHRNRTTASNIVFAVSPRHIGFDTPDSPPAVLRLSHCKSQVLSEEVCGALPVRGSPQLLLGELLPSDSSQSGAT
jgi:hypothetical protein